MPVFYQRDGLAGLGRRMAESGHRRRGGKQGRCLIVAGRAQILLAEPQRCFEIRACRTSAPGRAVIATTGLRVVLRLLQDRFLPSLGGRRRCCCLQEICMSYSWLILVLILMPASKVAGQDGGAESTRRDVSFTVAADDDQELQAKLSLPGQGDGPFPVVYFLHGAGPRTCDNPFRYRDEQGLVQLQNYLDFHADELTRRGIAFCRMAKRGCHTRADNGQMHVDRELFLAVTPSRLLMDYRIVFEAMRRREELDAERIVLWGESEGTWMGPRLAREYAGAVEGIIMCGYAADNVGGTVSWQLTHGSWRGIRHLARAADDGELTESEYEAAVMENPLLKRVLPFASLDADQDKILTESDMVALREPLVQAIEQAVKSGNDELILQVMGQHVLASAYLSEWWDGEPNVEVLLALDCPLRIFHGELDANCRVEGVHEAVAAFEAAGKTNLSVKIYPRTDHGLDWSRESARAGGSPGYRDAFAAVEAMVESTR